MNPKKEIITNVQYGIKTFREGTPLDIKPIKFGFWFYVEAIVVGLTYWIAIAGSLSLSIYLLT